MIACQRGSRLPSRAARPGRIRSAAAIASVTRMTLRLQQLFELLDRQAGILDDAAHSECVDGIVAGNRDDPLTIRHHDVLSLAGRYESLPSAMRERHRDD